MPAKTKSRRGFSQVADPYENTKEGRENLRSAIADALANGKRVEVETRITGKIKPVRSFVLWQSSIVKGNKAYAAKCKTEATTKSLIKK